jgi:CheY-like chemotaxis protein
MLKRLQYDVSHAENGQACVDLFNEASTVNNTSPPSDKMQRQLSIHTQQSNNIGDGIERHTGNLNRHAHGHSRRPSLHIPRYRGHSRSPSLALTPVIMIPQHSAADPANHQTSNVLYAPPPLVPRASSSPIATEAVNEETVAMVSPPSPSKSALGFVRSTAPAVLTDTSIAQMSAASSTSIRSPISASSSSSGDVSDSDIAVSIDISNIQMLPTPPDEISKSRAARRSTTGDKDRARIYQRQQEQQQRQPPYHPDNKKWPYDLILMDGEMPILNGFDATRRLRSMGVTIPILAVTGNALQEDKELFTNAGANEILTKPLQVDLLKQTLLKYLKQKSPTNA